VTTSEAAGALLEVIVAFPWFFMRLTDAGTLAGSVALAFSLTRYTLAGGSTKVFPAHSAHGQ
jgi:hypothetical protein